MNKQATKVIIDNDAGGVIVNDENIIGPPFPLTCAGALRVVAGLRPKQVRAAMMLVEGRMAKEVAWHLHVSPETVSRWRNEPEFQLLIQDLLRESIDATKLGLLSLFSESIVHLRQIMSVINDDATQLKAISLLFSKAGPVLAAISAEVQRPLTRNAEIVSRESHRITEPSAYLNGSVAENSTVRS